jgi:hypothetical protein
VQFARTLQLVSDERRPTDMSGPVHGHVSRHDQQHQHFREDRRCEKAMDHEPMCRVGDGDRITGAAMCLIGMSPHW